MPKMLERGSSDRRGLLGLVVVLLVFTTVALSAWLASDLRAQTPASPIKIGLLMPGSGPFTVNGQRITISVRLFFQTKEWQVAGRKIELVSEDTQGEAQVALTKTQRLVEKEGVHALIAYVTTPSAYAARDYLTAAKMPTVVVTGAHGLVHPGSPQRSPYMFRSYISLYGYGKALAEWIHGKARHNRVILVASNFGGALEPAFAFTTTFQKLGGQIVIQIRPPLATVDWSPWLSQVAAAMPNADALIAMAYGADALRMVQNWRELGLKGKIPLYGGEAFLSEMLLPAMGQAAEGIRQIDSYCPTLDTPENQNFVRLVRTAGQYPAENNYYGWSAAQAMWEGLRGVGGRAEDREALAKALEQVQFANLMGPFRYDQNHNPIVDTYIQEVRRVGGEFHNTCVERIPSVGHPGEIPFPPR